mmetsp:Transcript_20013/g.27453  ORF Transcript_20013/g.27453 Transcript_20013/m.27453 type:complete len:227 (-) Transcript_20013:1013-1693(-)
MKSKDCKLKRMMTDTPTFMVTKNAHLITDMVMTTERRKKRLPKMITRTITIMKNAQLITNIHMIMEKKRDTNMNIARMNMIINMGMIMTKWKKTVMTMTRWKKTAMTTNMRTIMTKRKKKKTTTITNMHTIMTKKKRKKRTTYQHGRKRPWRWMTIRWQHPLVDHGIWNLPWMPPPARLAKSMKQNQKKKKRIYPHSTNQEMISKKRPISKWKHPILNHQVIMRVH